MSGDPPERAPDKAEVRYVRERRRDEGVSSFKVSWPIVFAAVGVIIGLLGLLGPWFSGNYKSTTATTADTALASGVANALRLNALEEKSDRKFDAIMTVTAEIKEKISRMEERSKFYKVFQDDGPPAKGGPR